MGGEKKPVWDGEWDKVNIDFKVRRKYLSAMLNEDLYDWHFVTSDNENHYLKNF